MSLPCHTPPECFDIGPMIRVRWLEANARMKVQEMAVPTPEQLSLVNVSRKLDLFKTTCRILRIPKAIERIRARQMLLSWFHAVMTSWIYEHVKRHMSRRTEAYQFFQLKIERVPIKRVFLTHRNAVTTAVKRDIGLSCTNESEKKGVLRADLKRNEGQCLHNSFCRNRKQKVNVNLLLCCRQRLLEQENWRHGLQLCRDLQKVLEHSEMGEQEIDAMEKSWGSLDEDRNSKR